MWEKIRKFVLEVRLLYYFFIRDNSGAVTPSKTIKRIKSVNFLFSESEDDHYDKMVKYIAKLIPETINLNNSKVKIS